MHHSSTTTDQTSKDRSKLRSPLRFHWQWVKIVSEDVVLLWCTYDFQKLLLLQERFWDYLCFLYNAVLIKYNCNPAPEKILPSKVAYCWQFGFFLFAGSEKSSKIQYKKYAACQIPNFCTFSWILLMLIPKCQLKVSWE